MAAGILDAPPGGRGYLMLARFPLLILRTGHDEGVLRGKEAAAGDQVGPYGCCGRCLCHNDLHCFVVSVEGTGGAGRARGNQASESAG